MEDCAANTAGGLARAQFLGWFFNDTQTTPSSNNTGNIIAGINVAKLSDGSNQIQPVFVRCMNSGCTSTATPAGVTLPTFASTWSLNTPLIIKIVWNQALGKFNLKVTDQVTQTSETQVINYSGIVTDAGIPTSFDFKVFRVQNGVENCSSGRKQAMIDALFDNVNVMRAP